jgi:hypothetical protein
MTFATWFWLLETALFLYCLGGSWMLQNIAYPTYHLVGEKEFVPFHMASGQRLIPIFVIPAVLACFASLGLPFVRPDSIPFWVGAIVAICGLVILVTTIIIEVPKHNALDQNGKSTELINGLVRDNLPRAIAWSIGAVLLLSSVVTLLSA